MNELDRLMPERTDHPSQRMLEQLAFDHEGTHEGTQLERHVASCDACSNAVEGLRAERAAFLALRPAPAFAQKIVKDERRRRSWRPVAGVLSAIAATVLLAMGLLLKDPEIRLKGGSSAELHLFVSRDHAPATPYRRGMILKRGDVLRFAVSSDRPGFAFIADLDERGRFSRFFPAEEPMSAPIERGRNRLLPGSIELDDFVGKEASTLIVSTRRLSEEEVRAAILGAFERAGRDLSRFGEVVVDGEARILVFEKGGP